MLRKKLPLAFVSLGLALSIAGCANDSLFGNSGETAALPAKPAIDPACAPLAAKIDDLRREGVADRVEQAATGKGATVSVKRESLAKVAELNKANAEFQQKCSAYSPAPGAAKPATVSYGVVSAAPTRTAAVAKSPAAKSKASPPAVSDAASDQAKKPE